MARYISTSESCDHVRGITALLQSVGIAFAGLDDANEMVSECRMATGQLHFGHVAAGAVLFCDRAGFRGCAGGCGLSF